jgi:hypothetical protein
LVKNRCLLVTAVDEVITLVGDNRSGRPWH